MIDFLKVYNYIVINEGYKEVKSRITPILTSKIPNFDPDLIKMAFSKHQKNKDRLPEEYRNINVYFSKKFDNDIVSRYNDLVNELDKIPDVQITKGEIKRELYNNLKLTENNEYMLFKVPTHEDAVKLVRPGKNVPEGCSWPSMLPVSWCITVDTEQGKYMWENYTLTDDEEVIPYKIDDKGVHFKVSDALSYFYFAFRKHPLLDQEIESLNMQGDPVIYKVNPKDFLAIQVYADGHFETTQSPNDTGQTPHIEGWPNTVPEEWKKYCKFANIPREYFVEYSDLTYDEWFRTFLKFPDILKRRDMLIDVTPYGWLKIVARYPEFADRNTNWGIYDPYDWVFLLMNHPEFVGKANEYKIWNKFVDRHWIEVLKKQPQFAKYLDNIHEEHLSQKEWKHILEEHPFVLKYALRTAPGQAAAVWVDPSNFSKCNKADKFSSLEWARIISAHPEMVSKCPILDQFSDEYWYQLTYKHPQLKNIAKQYGAKQYGW